MKVWKLICLFFINNYLIIFDFFKKYYMQKLITEKVDWFLNELVYKMAWRTRKVVSVPTLWQSLSFCGITRKKVRIQYTLILWLFL